MAEDYAEFARQVAAADIGGLSKPGESTTITSPVSPQQLIIVVERERHAPELLPYPDSLISATFQKIVEQNDKIAQLDEQARSREAAASVQPSLLPFSPADLYRVEIQRLLFLVTELMRIRLKKIHKMASLIASDPAAFADILTPNETAVALRVHQLVQQAVLDGGLRLVAPELQSLLPSSSAEGPECLPRPWMDQFVLATALRPTVLTFPDVDEAQDMEPGVVWVCRYADLKSYIMAGAVRLV